MIGDNHHYGHSRILAHYCGLQDTRPIPFGIQHGWQRGDGFWPGAHELYSWPKLVWSSENLKFCRDRGFMDVEAIGAPFLYQSDLDRARASPPSMGKRSLLVYPFHGWEQQSVLGSFDSLADSISELQNEGFGPITVCLYWKEHAEEAVRTLFEDRGWHVTTNGHRDANPDFLVRQVQQIADHAHVTSNRIATVSFYAAYLHRPFFLWGPAMSVAGNGELTADEYDSWQRREFSMFIRGSESRDQQSEVAEHELGLGYKRTPEDLVKLFGWNRHSLTRRVLNLCRKRSWRRQHRRLKARAE